MGTTNFNAVHTLFNCYIYFNLLKDWTETEADNYSGSAAAKKHNLQS